MTPATTADSAKADRAAEDVTIEAMDTTDAETSITAVEDSTTVTMIAARIQATGTTTRHTGNRSARNMRGAKMMSSKRGHSRTDLSSSPRAWSQR